MHTKIVVITHEKGGSSVKVSGEKVWPSEAYYKNQLVDYNMKKVNYPEN